VRMRPFKRGGLMGKRGRKRNYKMTRDTSSESKSPSQSPSTNTKTKLEVNSN
jgi:hypothetical protein